MTNNFLINGNFDLWQRGITFNIPWDHPDSLTVYTAPNLKIADRWYVHDTLGRGPGSTGSINFYREEFPQNSRFSSFAKYYLTVQNQLTDIESGHLYIENKQEDCRKYSNTSLAFSFYAKSINGATGITMSCYYRQAINPNNQEVGFVFSNIEIQPQWTFYSLEFSPFASNFSGISGDHYFSVGFRANPNSNFSIANVFLQENKNDNNSFILFTDPEEEKKRQEKYYKTSYPIGFTAGSVTITNENDTSAVFITTTPNYSSNYTFDVPMRKIPTITTYSPKSGTQNDAYNKTATKDMRLTSGTRGWNQATRFSPTGAETISSIGNTYGIQFNISSGAVVFDDLLVHFVADADINTGSSDRGLETLDF
jgi:hypothetical protein